jgi:hypothetical protein
MDKRLKKIKKICDNLELTKEEKEEKITSKLKKWYNFEVIYSNLGFKIFDVYNVAFIIDTETSFKLIVINEK